MSTLLSERRNRRAEALGVLGSRWPVRPLKYSLDYLEGPGIMAADFANEGIPLLRISGLAGRYATLEGCDYLAPALVESKWRHFRVKAGDLLISGSASTGLCAEVRSDTAGAVPYTGIIIIRPRSGGLDIGYARWFLLSELFARQVTLLQAGSAIQHFGPSHLARMFAPVPPPQQQRAIAKYLDLEVGFIDDTIGTKQRILNLLFEKRHTVIAEAVTRGTDGDTNLRDSLVEWLGQIPAHWEIERARWLFRERDERSKLGDEELLTVSHLTGVTPRSEKDVNMFEAETNEGYKICFAGDLVINTLWAWMGAMGIAPVNGIVSPAYNVYEPGPRLEPAYIDALVRLPVFAQEVMRYSKGVWSSRLRLYPEGFFETYLPVPPLSEQRSIVNHLANEICNLDALRSAAEKTIDLLKERRAAIIEAAVTGQIELENAT